MKPSRVSRILDEWSEVSSRARRPEADLRHRVLEFQAVFGLVDGFGRGPDELDLEFFAESGEVRSRFVDRRG